MKNLLLILSVGLLVGCGKSASSEESLAPAPKAAEFKKGQGLLLTAEATQFIGLRAAETQTKGAAVRIPMSAVVDTAEGQQVFVQSGQRWLRTAVRLGAASGELVEVADGLLEGDVVAVAGGWYLWMAELQAIKGGVGCADGH
jgi:hypothetical protein